MLEQGRISERISKISNVFFYFQNSNDKIKWFHGMVQNRCANPWLATPSTESDILSIFGENALSQEGKLLSGWICSSANNFRLDCGVVLTRIPSILLPLALTWLNIACGFNFFVSLILNLNSTYKSIKSKIYFQLKQITRASEFSRYRWQSKIPHYPRNPG